jgi:FkbM family methyltransferase
MTAKYREKTILDLGANTGHNFKYYLDRFARVVALEPNPACVARIKQEHAEALESGRLELIECAVTHTRDTHTDLYLPPGNDNHPTLGSTAVVATCLKRDHWNKLKVPAMNIIDLLKREEFHYVKMDLEGYEPYVLREMFLNGIYPETLCVECHDKKTLCWVIAGGYEKFKPVLGPNKSPGTWKSKEGDEFKFWAHEAGPIWEDNKERDFHVDQFFDHVSNLDINACRDTICGWYDLHCRRILKSQYIQ